MDQTGSVSYMPYIGVILLMPHDPNVIARFDAVATGIVPLDVLGQGETDRGHIQLAEYEPEMVYLGEAPARRLISGWDIAGIARPRHRGQQRGERRRDPRLEARGERSRSRELLLVHDPKEPTGREKAPGDYGQFVVDSTTEVLLGRMENIARLVGVLSLLVALPLLWMAWVLAPTSPGC